MKRRLLLAFAVLLLSTGLSNRAFADGLTFSLVSSNQSVMPGQTASYQATIVNNTSSTIFLNGDSFNIASPLILYDSGFNTTPQMFNPGDSFAGILFTVMAPSTSATGSFVGNFSLLGGADMDASANMGSVTFTTTVTPEPSSWLLMATGTAGLFFFVRRNRFAASSMLA